MPNPNNALIIKYAFSDKVITDNFNIYGIELADFPNPYTDPDLLFDYGHGGGLGYINDFTFTIAEDLKISYSEVKKVLYNRLYLKKLYNKLNLLEVKYKITNNTELLNAIRRRIVSRRIAFNKIKRNAIYNTGLGLKLAVKAFNKDF
jgi:hypothetical protein